MLRLEGQGANSEREMQPTRRRTCSSVVVKRKGKVVGEGGGEEARGGGVRGGLVCAGRKRAAVDVEGDAQRRSLGNDETSLALQVGVEGSAAKAERCVRGGLRLPSSGSEELSRLTVGLKEEEARELAVHAARSAYL